MRGIIFVTMVMCCACTPSTPRPEEIASTARGETRDEPSEEHHVELRRSEDEVRVTFEEDSAQIDVRSPSGIGGATITKRRGPWPSKVIVNLHLHGLEVFNAETEQATIYTRIDSGTSAQVSPMGVIRDDVEDRIGSDDPLWTPVTIIRSSSESPPAMPLNDGHFRVSLPSALFSPRTKTLRLGWIDFYRR